MVFLSPKPVTRFASLSVAAFLVLAGLSARAQYLPSGAYPASGVVSPPMTPQMAQPTGGTYPGPAMMYPPTAGTYYSMPPVPYQPYFCPPHPCLPGPSVPTPGQPSTPGQPGTPSEPAQPSQPSQQPQFADTNLPSDLTPNQGLADLASEQGAASGTGNVALLAPGGYLENPIPISTFRLRFDAAYGVNHPDRAEYIYGAWQELGFHPHGIQGAQGSKGVFFDPKAIGPAALPTNVNYQTPDAYLEFAFMNRFSAFVDAPYRMIDFRQPLEDNPEKPNAEGKFFPEPQNGAVDQNIQTNHNGFSDLQFGFKGALLASPTQFLTIQLRTYTPTGNSFHGLGTGHWSIEPSLLFYQRWNRLVLQGQLTDWVPIHGGEAGNVLSYGAGLGYAVYQRGNFAIMPISEFLGWTVLNGYEAAFGTFSPNAGGVEVPTTHGVLSAGGNTIVNGKFGARIFFGNGSSLYFGYGRALTGTHWYTDDFRVEYRLFFGAGRNLFRAL